jgi:Tripartite tricarboxylate transporter family receptor
VAVPSRQRKRKNNDSTPTSVGVAGPKGREPKAVAKIHDAFKKALEDPTVLSALEKFEMVPNYLGSADYTRFVQAFMVSERKALTDIGLARKWAGCFVSARGRRGSLEDRFEAALACRY